MSDRRRYDRSASRGRGGRDFAADPRPPDRGSRDFLADVRRGERRRSRSRSRDRRRDDRGGGDAALALSGPKSREKLSRTAGFDAAQPITDAATVTARLAQINAERALITPPFIENPEVEAFLTQHTLENAAVARLRALPPDQAKMVMDVSLDRARNKTAVILSRIKFLSTGCMNPAGIQAPPAREERRDTGLIALLPRPNYTPPSQAKLEEMANRVNQDLVHQEAVKLQFPGDKIPSGKGGKGGKGGRPPPSSQPQPIPYGQGGAPDEEDMAIESFADPGGASAGAPSSGASTSGRHGGGAPILRPFASNPVRRKASPPRKAKREPTETSAEDASSRPIMGEYMPPEGLPKAGGMSGPPGLSGRRPPPGMSPGPRPPPARMSGPSMDDWEWSSGEDWGGKGPWGKGGPDDWGGKGPCGKGDRGLGKGRSRSPSPAPRQRARPAADWSPAADGGPNVSSDWSPAGFGGGGGTTAKSGSSAGPLDDFVPSLPPEEMSPEEKWKLQAAKFRAMHGQGGLGGAPVARPRIPDVASTAVAKSSMSMGMAPQVSEGRGAAALGVAKTGPLGGLLGGMLGAKSVSGDGSGMGAGASAGGGPSEERGKGKGKGKGESPSDDEMEQDDRVGVAKAGGPLGGLLGGILGARRSAEAGRSGKGAGASSSSGPLEEKGKGKGKGKGAPPADDDMEQDDDDEKKTPSFSSILDMLNSLKNKEVKKKPDPADDDMEQLPPRPAEFMASSSKLRDLAWQAANPPEKEEEEEEDEEEEEEEAPRKPPDDRPKASPPQPSAQAPKAGAPALPNFRGFPPAGADSEDEPMSEEEEEEEVAKREAAKAAAAAAAVASGAASCGQAAVLDPSLATAVLGDLTDMSNPYAQAIAAGADPTQLALAAQLEGAQNKRYEEYWIQYQQAAHQALYATQRDMSNMYSNAWENARAVLAMATGSPGHKEDKWGMMKTAADRARAMLTVDKASGSNEWACPSCGAQNPMHNTTCSECGAKRPAEMTEMLMDMPPELARFFSQEGEDSNKNKRPKGKGKHRGKDPGEQWFCTSCGFANRSTNEVCGGMGPLGCKKPKPKLMMIAGQITA